MTKRLFVSIPIPTEWQNAFAGYYAQFKVRDVRWTAEENIHITACFLGDVDEQHFGEVKERIKDVCANTEPFSLIFEKISFAPPGMPPRMVWAEFQESDVYRQLAQDLQDTLKSFLAVEPHKETIPHATLARFKNPILAKEMNIEKSKPELTSFDVRSIELVESRLDPAGVQHETLEIFPLTKHA